VRSGAGIVGYGGLERYGGGPKVEVSYQVVPREWGKGYGLAIVHHSVKYAFAALGLAEIWAETQAANTPSRRILERSGFHLVANVERHGAPQSVYLLRR
jgi:ribosomal-protein-alanine N-acetyltransferase